MPITGTNTVLAKSDPPRPRSQMSAQAERGLLRRIRRASWAELKTRVQQELSKRSDYLFYCLGSRLETSHFDPRKQISAGQFFFSMDDIPLICAEIRRRVPEAVKKIQDSAEQIRAHRFHLLGYENIRFGDHVDWHSDLVHSKRAPRKPWFKIRYLDFDEVGDSKIIWELNRHQCLVTLAKAYVLTGETGYATELFRLWYDWREQNPYPIGTNWASSLEVAFRSLSWIWIDHLLQASTVMPQAFPRDLTRALRLNGRHIEKYLSTYFSPNTHLLGEGLALFSIGLLYPAIEGADRWKRRGWEIIEEQAARQVESDGMHFEQSLHYHVYALDMFLHARILASKNQISLNPEFDNTIVKMLEALCTLSQAGPPPHFGDDDGGRVFDPSRNEVQHMLDPLSTGALVYCRGDFKSAGKLCEETLWLLGADAIGRLDSLESKTGHFPSALSASGIYVMAHRDGHQQQLVVDGGAMGRGRAGHSHADTLGLHLSVGGREILSDPGTFSYVSADIDRNRLRGTGAHNTLRIDGLDQAEPTAPFGWRALPKASVELWQNGREFDLFIANQSPRGSSSEPVHQRTIFYLKPQFWLVRDVVSGEGQHELDLFWHFPPGIEISERAVSGSWAIRHRGEEQSLALVMPEDQMNPAQVEEDYWSPSYGKVVPSRTLRVSRNGALPCEFATMLVPIHDRSVKPGILTRLDGDHHNPGLRSYTYQTAGESHFFFFNDSGRPWNGDIWTSDARFFYCAMRATGTPIDWIVSRASFLSMRERPLFAKGEFVEWREQLNPRQIPEPKDVPGAPCPKPREGLSLAMTQKTKNGDE